MKVTKKKKKGTARKKGIEKENKFGNKFHTNSSCQWGKTFF